MSVWPGAGSWVFISTDPITGNGQKGETFWERVGEDFNNHIGGGPSNQRSAVSLMNHRSALHLRVSKFCGYYAEVLRLNPSGKTNEEKINDAAEMYKELEGSVFMH